VTPYLKTPFTKIGLVEWLKVKALSSSPSTAKKRKRKGSKSAHVQYRHSLYRPNCTVHSNVMFPTISSH
jgi:hypothetical protein